MKDDERDHMDVESQTGLCLVDEQGLIVEWSPGQEVITGLGRMEALGRSIWDVQYQFTNKNRQDAEEYGRLKKVFLQIFSTGQLPPDLQLVDVYLKRSDGTSKNIQIVASPIKTPGGYMLSCLFRDVTEQKRMERTLQEARAEAELANRAKGQFLARMSHEIRTPLHGITGLTQVLSRTCLTSEQSQYLNMIRSSADLLLQVVNDILDFSKIESGRFDLEEVPFDFRDIVERASDAVALAAFEKGLELVVHLPPVLPAPLLGDPARLQQVLVNLLNNAVKFAEKGQVLLRVQAESEQPEVITLHITVEDTGIGIAEDKQALIFEAFRQSDDSTTRQYGGTGLGLSIAAQLVELMGGRIRVESKLNQGSRFEFSLAFKKQGTFDLLAAPARWQDVPVLIVEDNAAARLALEEILRAWGLKVTAAENGLAALQALDRTLGSACSFRLVLLDLTLPDLNAFDVAASMKSAFPNVHLVMLSPAQSPGDLAHSRELGIGARLFKPIKYRDLRRALEVILDTVHNADQSGGEERQAPPRSIESLAKGLRILLADDNRVGQVIGEWMLKELGHVVETASNGEEVLAKLQATEFDLILMDLEMPQMDGWQALRAIRRREMESGHRRVRVLAVTAYASTENRDAAIEAGMDGYLSKPFKIERLQEALKPFLRLSESRSDPPIFDHGLALDAADGSDEILDEVVEIFLKEDYPRHLHDLRMAVEEQDGEMLRRAAHGVKGALASFGGSAVAAVARQLQEIGMRGEMDLAPQKLAELEHEVGRFAACFERPIELSRQVGSQTSPNSN